MQAKSHAEIKPALSPEPTPVLVDISTVS